MSRNDERIILQTDDSLPTIQQSQNQDFSFPMSTVFVTLPSKGKFYPEGHPLKGKESIEIKMMTTKEEDILTNKSLLKKGIAIDRLLHSLLVDKSIDLDSLLIGDKNALIIEARISGYGNDYVTKFKCPSCDETSETSFDLEEAKKINYGEDVIEGIEYTDKSFFVILPKCKVKVECFYLTGKDEKALMFLNEKKKKNNLPESMMTDQMKLFISSVNGDTSQKAIAMLVDNMPAIDSRWLRNVYKKVNPNIELIGNFSCKSCNHEEEVNVPLAVDFFWPQR